ncbi:MAG: hypothetical protein KDB03_15010 [Planctomycetales bacterium]|nr:hypothetical protein [Planctomycetales bacterium]
MHREEHWTAAGSVKHPFWSIEERELLRDLRTTDTGLSTVEAQRRIVNSRPLDSSTRSRGRLLIDQFKSPIIILLLCSAVLTFALSYYDASTNNQRFSLLDAPDGCIIVFILLASGLLGFWQELSAADAVARLLGLIETTATALRDGVETQVPLREIVSGDVVRLSAGDVIPGDCRILISEHLLVNESALTGESFPAEKFAQTLQTQQPLAARSNSLHLGTHVMSGIGTAVVVATGSDTEFGRISASLQRAQPETGFERGVRQFGQLLIKSWWLSPF